MSLQKMFSEQKKKCTTEENNTVGIMGFVPRIEKKIDILILNDITKIYDNGLRALWKCYLKINKAYFAQII